MSIIELNKNEIANIGGGKAATNLVKENSDNEGITGKIKRWWNERKKEIVKELDKFFNNSTIIVI